MSRVTSTSTEDTPEVVAAIRAECARRDAILKAERAKIRKPSSKLTKAERAHLHTFAFSSEQIRAEVLASQVAS